MSQLPIAPFRRGDHVELAERMLARIDENRENVIYDEGQLYRYVRTLGLWMVVTEDDQSRIVQRFAGASIAGPGREKTVRIQYHDVRGACGLAREMRRTPGYFGNAPVGLAFKNGFVQVDGVKGISVAKHHRDQKQRAGYVFAYEPEAKSAAFEKFVDDLFRDDPDKVLKIAFVQELFGAALMRVATRFQRCALFIGDGENGKDTLIDVLKCVFPPGTVTAVAPHKWSQDYSRAHLAGKWLNVVGELPETDLATSEAFKAIVGGSEIDGRHPFGQPFPVTPQAGHVFATNTAMGTPDFTHGFFRRFGVVRFNRTFTDQERDVGLKARLIESHDVAIISWLIEGARRLLARGRYQLPDSHETELRSWRSISDQVTSYFETLTAVSGAALEPAEALYQHFAEWASAHGHKQMAHTKFGVRMRAVLKDAKCDMPPRKKSGIWYPVTWRPSERGVDKVQEPKSELSARTH